MTALYKIGDFVGYRDERPVAAPAMPGLWYLLRLHPNYDLKAERQLNDHGILAYVPKEQQTIRTVWNRKTVRTVPIFPGAMFVPDFEADIARLKRFASGIGGFVKTGGECLRISLDRMLEIRKFEEKRNRDPELRKLKLGQKIRMVDGSFDQMEGVIDRLDSNYRLGVLIEFLGQKVRIIVDEDQVEAV